MTGVGFTQWNIELLRVLNGKTGAWQPRRPFTAYKWLRMALHACTNHPIRIVVTNHAQAHSIKLQLNLPRRKLLIC